MKYQKRDDGEAWTVKSGAVHRIACCDCALVHDFVHTSKDGKGIVIRAWRNNRATAAKRRQHDR